ncbi:MAG: hypothetical protein H0X38_06605 [Planctomycetes bacterium]|nr:hypothetical protein [Planctomycetota bacterium]
MTTSTLPLTVVLLATSWLVMLAAGESAGQQVTLVAPMNTTVPAVTVPPLPVRLDAVVIVPADAPGDLGVGAYAADGQGHWFRSPRTYALTPGRHQLTFDLGDRAALVQEPAREAWTATARARTTRAGLFLWSASASRAQIAVERLVVVGEKDQPGAQVRLTDLRLDGYDVALGQCRGRTGERWQLSVRPDPFPAQPYDPQRFALAVVVTGPNGQQWRLGAFYRQPLDIVDRGDHEEGVPSAAAAYLVRFRPELPGRYRLRLEAVWGGSGEFPPAKDAAKSGRTLAWDLPDLQVEGAPWDDYVRADPADPRFFSTGSRIGPGTFFWPRGLNLHSVWDVRCRDCTGTKLTPHRLLAGYDAYLRRLAAGGGTAAEIWLSSWSLCLEWRGDWSGFHGPGWYSDENAERLDRLLDLAYSLGVRINLVINNHGQGSTNCDKEWDNNPWNAAIGGPLAQAELFFTDAQALAGQERLRRYIVARWGDHPAVLGWKLWSEQNLTTGGGNLFHWHQAAAERWQQLDGAGHGVTTHWSGDYRAAERRIVQLPGLNYVCIDAYHGGESMLAQLVWDSVNARDGLRIFGKPVIITEFGGTSGGCPPQQLIAEHHSGPWAAMVSGNAGSPMLWWGEWVDQGERWSPYAALGRFLEGEDLRGDSKAVELQAPGQLWVRAWARPGRLLGYVLDRAWGSSGNSAGTLSGLRVQVGDAIHAGVMNIEWWDAETGRIVHTDRVAHAGGPLEVVVPDFTRHLAFKLIRLPDPPATAVR